MLVLAAAALGCVTRETPFRAAALTDEQGENLVRRSYQYVAMYNVNNKFAEKHGEWNTVSADTQLKDHSMREIARPNAPLCPRSRALRDLDAAAGGADPAPDWSDD